MNYQYQKPHPSISEYVRTVLVLDGFAEPGISNLPLVTQGMPALLCKESYNKCTLTLFGKSVPPEQWEVGENTSIAAYFFKPFSMACFFNVDAKKLVTAPVKLPDINNRAEVDQHLIRYFEANKKQCEIIRRATDFIMLNPNTEVLSELLTMLGLTERTFQRIFKKFIGITPSQYRRICQFDQSFMQLRTKDFEALSDIAFDNGFADQSHFIRTFKEFTDTTPKTYLKEGLK